MATEVRIYTVKPGKFDDFFEIFRSNIMPTSASYGVRIHAAWRCDDRNQIVWVRSYDDAATLERYEKSAERATYLPKVQECLEAMDVRIVESLLGDLPVMN